MPSKPISVISFAVSGLYAPGNLKIFCFVNLLFKLILFSAEFFFVNAYHGYYSITIITAVATNNKANKYSIIFLIFVFLSINLNEEPKRAHKQIEGKQTNGAVPATNIVAIIKFSSLGKKAVAAVNATTHALGLIN